ncbi:hypothetical protein HDU93_000024 [Gonapodya sp. JEL0774]|nr:hypothetical protein HDU93_000024 [Gonapodya sp. JEL0774]
MFDLGDGGASSQTKPNPADGAASNAAHRTPRGGRDRRAAGPLRGGEIGDPPLQVLAGLGVQARAVIRVAECRGKVDQAGDEGTTPVDHIRDVGEITEQPLEEAVGYLSRGDGRAEEVEDEREGGRGYGNRPVDSILNEPKDLGAGGRGLTLGAVG